MSAYLQRCFYESTDPPPGRCPRFGECDVADPECWGSLCDGCARDCKSTRFIIVICEKYEAAKS